MIVLDSATPAHPEDTPPPVDAPWNEGDNGRESNLDPNGSGLGGRLRRPLDTLLSRQLTRPVTRTQANNLRLFWIDGIYSSASEGFSLAYIPLFALAYGATAAQVGLIASVSNLLGALALFPGARALESTGRRKPLILWSGGGLGRAPLLLLAMLPLFALVPENAIVAIIALSAVRSVGLNFANPAWTSLTADLVPMFMRGRYFSLRNLLMGIATLFAPPVAGWIINWSEGGTEPLRGFQAAFLIAFGTGMVSTWYFSRIREPAYKWAGVQAAPRRSPLALLSGSPALAGFVVSAFVWNLSLQVAAPYFNVYLVTQLGGDATTVGIVTAISALAGLVGLVLFGRLADRRGSTWVFLFTGIAITVLPMAWYFYTAPWQVGINNMFGGLLWAGFNLATFNLLLLLTPDDQRPRAVALFQTAVFTGSVIGPLIGGYLADNVSFPLVFLVSGFGRLLAMIIFVLMGTTAAFAQERLLTSYKD